MADSCRILITGGNTGIGKAIAKKLLREGHRVVITSRDECKGRQAIDEIIQDTGSDQADLLVGDLSSISTTYELAQKAKEHFGDLSVLINNAGIWNTQRELNEDGLEKSFMVNHVAPYLLSKELFSTLQDNRPARIVNVNAGLYVNGKVDLDKTPTGKDFNAMKTYATTKLCSVLTTFHLARALEGTGVTINAVHPGVINTGLGDSGGFLSKIMKLIKRFWKDPDHGAIAPAWLATDESAAELNGKYFDELKPHTPTESALDKTLQQDLAALTDKMIVQALSKSEPPSVS